MRNSHEIFKQANTSNPHRVLHLGDRHIQTQPSDDILEIFKNFGKSKGWMFLLEVPADLFSEPNLRAAAFCRWDQPSSLLYVLFDKTGLQVVVYDETEAPAEANQLVHSYSWVVRQLDGTRSARSLH